MDGISLDAISVTLRFDLCSIMLNDLAEAIRRWTEKKKNGPLYLLEFAFSMRRECFRALGI